MSALTIDFAGLLRVSKPIVEKGFPVLIRGRHGVGKSEVVYMVGERLFWNAAKGTVHFIGDANKVPDGYEAMEIVERRASQMTEGDLVGLPSVNGNRTTFNPPDWFKLCCEKPCLLFIDEIDRGTIEVRQGFFELTDSRKLNGHKLHPGTRIYAAVNGGKHGASYQVGEMDPAELDRWTVFDVEPTLEDWMNWAAMSNKAGERNIDPMITDFIRDCNGKHLEHKEEFEPNKKYPSRRSWKRANDSLVAAGFLDGNQHTGIEQLTGAFVGMEAAIGLGEFIRTYKKKLTPEDIIVKGRWKEAEKFTNTDHVNLCEKIQESGLLAKKFTENEAINFGRYFKLLPAEVATLLFKYLGKAGNKENTILFYKLKIDGVAINQLMVNMLAPQTATTVKK